MKFHYRTSFVIPIARIKRLILIVNYVTIWLYGAVYYVNMKPKIKKYPYSRYLIILQRLFLSQNAVRTLVVWYGFLKLDLGNRLLN